MHTCSISRLKNRNWQLQKYKQLCQLCVEIVARSPTPVPGSNGSEMFEHNCYGLRVDCVLNLNIIPKTYVPWLCRS